MLRKITKDIGRYKIGQEIGLPQDIWFRLEREAGLKLDMFSIELKGEPASQSRLKGKFRAHTRLGATQ